MPNLNAERFYMYVNFMFVQKGSTCLFYIYGNDINTYMYLFLSHNINFISSVLSVTQNSVILLSFQRLSPERNSWGLFLYNSNFPNTC